MVYMTFLYGFGTTGVFASSEDFFCFEGSLRNQGKYVETKTQHSKQKSQMQRMAVLLCAWR